jgi:hypothetical protein
MMKGRKKTQGRGMMFLYGLLVLGACQQEAKNKSHADVNDASIRAGRKLAGKYCRSCHLLPEPGQLDAKHWKESVLPQMGPRLGIYGHDFVAYPSYRNDPNCPAGYYPSKPVISTEQWQQIIDYYSALAPDSLVASVEDKPIETTLEQFAAVILPLSIPFPRVSFLRVDASFAPAALLMYEQNRKQLYRVHQDLQEIDSLAIRDTVVDLSRNGQQVIFLNIGVMAPNNGKFGTALSLTIDPEGQWKNEQKLVLTSLRRPVRLIEADLNQDGVKDLLVCEFGHLAGSLSWFERKSDTGLERHLIRESPGAIQAVLHDLNRDGSPDVLAQFTQGDESIYAFVNDGKGNFTSRQLLRFPPSYGSSHFELADFNGDGAIDILYTCGDNADYSIMFKPYHGVYIFLNDGKDNFSKSFFFHINGSFKALARDFDRDGDLDIATIAFFADFQQRPEEGFVYLRNNGGMSFSAYSHAEARKGRWLTMDAGDIDGDGWEDIVLGNFSAPAMTETGTPTETGPVALVLLNRGNKTASTPTPKP